MRFVLNVPRTAKVRTTRRRSPDLTPRSWNRHLPRPAGLAAFALFALLSASCGSDDTGADSGRPQVVVTTTILGDVVADIAEGQADVDVLMPIGADPHEFSLSVRQAADMQEADLIVINGLGFEAGLLDAIDAAAAGGVPIVDLGEQIDPRPFDRSTDSEDHEDDGDADPHWFTDPVRMAEAAELIGDALAEETGAGSPVRAQADQVAQDLRDLDNEIRSLLDAIPADRRMLVTNHEVFGYFSDRYGLTVVDVVVPGGTTLSQPGSAELADLVDTIEQADVEAIFVETSSASDLAEAVADEVDRPVAIVELFTESLGPEGSGGETYIDMMRTDAERIAEALG